MAFDKIKHEELINLLRELHFDSKDIRLIANLYWEQMAEVRVDNKLSEWKA